MWPADHDALAPARLTRPASLRTAADAFRAVGEELAQATVEILRLAHLDHDGRLIAIDEQTGNHDMLNVATARIIRAACSRGTRQLLIAHNHPSGDPTPSRADRIATRDLAALLRLVEIELVDHLVIARGGVSSFRRMGLL
jgi:DNA repair protein RadC